MVPTKSVIIRENAKDLRDRPTAVTRPLGDDNTPADAGVDVRRSEVYQRMVDE